VRGCFKAKERIPKQMPYEQLDTGKRVRDQVGLKVSEARIASGPSGKYMHVQRQVDHLTLGGIRVERARAFVNERRALIVSFDSTDPPGTLGYAVTVRGGCTVGDHYHHRREERVILLHGKVMFRLQDMRPDSPTAGVINLFEVGEPGVGVHIPTGIAHSILAEGGVAVLQVLASSDYSPDDDVHVDLSML
jgi:dTDP-4-dehydrorhamnose 3,5-epimerase-like enzyme